MDAGKVAAVTREDEEEEEEEDDESDQDASPPPKKRKTAATTATTAIKRGGRGRPAKEKTTVVKPRAQPSTDKASKVDTTGESMVKDDNGLFSACPQPLADLSLIPPRQTPSSSRISRSSRSSRIGSPTFCPRVARMKKYTFKSSSCFSSGYVDRHTPGSATRR